MVVALPGVGAMGRKGELVFVKVEHARQRSERRHKADQLRERQVATGPQHIVRGRERLGLL